MAVLSQWSITEDGLELYSTHTTLGELTYLPTNVGSLGTDIQLRDASDRVLGSLSMNREMGSLNLVIEDQIAAAGQAGPTQAAHQRNRDIIRRSDYPRLHYKAFSMEYFSRCTSLQSLFPIRAGLDHRPMFLHEYCTGLLIWFWLPLKNLYAGQLFILNYQVPFFHSWQDFSGEYQHIFFMIGLKGCNGMGYVLKDN